MRCLQAGDVRTAIGSGLLHLGLLPGATVGLYSINCRGEHGRMPSPLQEPLPDAPPQLCELERQAIG